MIYLVSKFLINLTRSSYNYFILKLIIILNIKLDNKQNEKYHLNMVTQLDYFDYIEIVYHNTLYCNKLKLNIL